MDGTSARFPVRSPLRSFTRSLVVTVCALLLLHGFFFETFEVPSGSMAPALLGHHRATTCPRCGALVVIGRATGDRDGTGGERYYAKAWCQNCGCDHLNAGGIPETAGDQLFVNKSAFHLRRPRRWEVVVFRIFGIVFVKRIIGMPGETVELCDGDVYIDGQLARKTLPEIRAARVPLFDYDHAPPEGWNCRWERRKSSPVPPEAGYLTPTFISLDGSGAPKALTYRNFTFDSVKCSPIMDEYAYNAGGSARLEGVHDFMVELDVEIQAGWGTLTLGLFDGQDWAHVEIPVNQSGRISANRLSGKVRETLLEDGPERQLYDGRAYHLEMAFVDRRLSLALNGEEVFRAIDLSMAKGREAVERPFRVIAAGATVKLSHLRLYRDLHYSQHGQNAVAGRSVQLGMDEFFMLGDNSTNSEDSRMWPDQGRVPLANLMGSPFFVRKR